MLFQNNCILQSRLLGGADKHNSNTTFAGLERRQKPRVDRAKGDTIGDCLGLTNDV